MIRSTNTRGRWAALTAGALVAGGLVVAPALAGLSTANAATPLNYTCTDTVTGKVLAATVEVTVNHAASVAPDSDFPATVVTKTTMDTDPGASGVTGIEGTIEYPLTLGGATVNVVQPASWDGGPVVFEGSSPATLHSPAAVGAAPITLGTVTAPLTFLPFGVDLNFVCVPDAGQDLTVDTVTVEEQTGPTGLKYDCTEGADPTVLPAFVDLDVALPATVAQNAPLDPAVDAVVSWGDGTATPSSTATLDLGTITGGVAGTTPVALTGDTVWTGSGTWGAIDTSAVGSIALEAGDSTITTPDATYTCALAEGEFPSIGSVTVEKADPVAVPVTGKVAIKGTPKVGKTLTAVPGTTDGAKVAYQWMSNGKAIKKATKSTLKLDKSLKGKKVSVKATYTKSGFKKVVQTSKSVTVKK